MNDGISIIKQADGSFKSKISGIRTFEMVQYVTGYVEGDFNDWPANIQDKILAALERKSQQVELPLTIVHSSCMVDYGETLDRSQDHFYLHVIASEIVVADERSVNKMAIERAVADMINLRTKH